LSHAVGVVFDELVGHFGYFECFEVVADGVVEARGGHVVESCDEAHEFVSGEFFVEEGVIGDVAEEFFCFDGVLLDVESADGGGAGDGLDESGEHFDGGGFPGAVWAEEAEEFAFFDVEVESGDGDVVSESLAEVYCFCVCV